MHKQGGNLQVEKGLAQLTNPRDWPTLSPNKSHHVGHLVHLHVGHYIGHLVNVRKAILRVENLS